MDYPDETVAIGANGKKEARILRSIGTDFVTYGYFDISAGKMLAKYSILLRSADGKTVEHMMLVPTAGGKEMVVKHAVENPPRSRGIFDEKEKTVVYF